MPKEDIKKAKMVSRNGIKYYVDGPSAGKKVGSGRDLAMKQAVKNAKKELKERKKNPIGKKVEDIKQLEAMGVKKKKISETRKDLENMVKKGGAWPTVVNNLISDPIDLETNILSKLDTDALPFLIFLRMITKDLDLNETVVEDIKDGYLISIFKKENGIFSGHLMDKNSNIIMEFKDQTLSILASMIATKIGDESNTDEFGRDYEEGPMDEQEIFNSDDVVVAEPMEKPKKTEINIDKDGNINIQIMKSKEKEMKDKIQMLSELYEELTKAGKDYEGIDESKNLKAKEPIEDPEMEEGEMIEDDHEYVKTTAHDGGKQHWYKDPKTGKIIEKDNAPEGHEEYEHKKDIEALAEVVNDLADKVNAIEEDQGIVEEEAEESEEVSEEEVPLTEAENLESGKGKEEMDKEEQERVSEEIEEEKEDEPDELVEEEVQENVEKESPEEEVTEKPVEEAVEENAEEINEKEEEAKEEKEEEESEAPEEKEEEITEDLETVEDEQEEAEDAAEELTEEKDPDEVEMAADELAENANEDQAKKIIEKLKAKFPNLSKAQEEKVLEYLEKARTCNKSGDEEQVEDAAEALEDPTPEVKEEEGEEELKKKKIKKVMKKSRLQRMWKVFNINMPEKIESNEDKKLAKSGLEILGEKIANQGKDLEKAQEIAKNTFIEKYECEDLYKSVVEYKEEIKKPDFKVDYSKQPKDAGELNDMRKEEADARFDIPEFEKKDVELSKSVDTGINDQIAKLNPKPIFEDKEYNEEEVKKSMNQEASDREIMKQVQQDKNWDIPEYKEGKDQLSQEVKSDLNDQIKKSVEKPKYEEINWGDEFKPFDEEEVKKAMNKEETASEKFNKSNQIDFWKDEDERLEKADKFEIDEKAGVGENKENEKERKKRQKATHGKDQEAKDEKKKDDINDMKTGEKKVEPREKA